MRRCHIDGIFGLERIASAGNARVASSKGQGLGDHKPGPYVSKEAEKDDQGGHSPVPSTIHVAPA